MCFVVASNSNCKALESFTLSKFIQKLIQPSCWICFFLCTLQGTLTWGARVDLWARQGKKKGLSLSWQKLAFWRGLVEVVGMRMKRELTLIAGHETRAGIYHLIARTVWKTFLFKEQEKEQLRDIMRAYEGFCGVRVLTYCLTVKKGSVP